MAEILTGEHVHLTADEVYGRARQILPEISLATVYNTLNELADMGELLEIVAGDGPKRYDPNVTELHHHLHCVGCGKLRDVVPDGTEQLRLPEGRRHGFELLDVDIVFRGRCPDCRAAPLGGADARRSPVG